MDKILHKERAFRHVPYLVVCNRVTTLRRQLDKYNSPQATFFLHFGKKSPYHYKCPAEHEYTMIRLWT